MLPEVDLQVNLPRQNIDWFEEFFQEMDRILKDSRMVGRNLIKVNMLRRKGWGNLAIYTQVDSLGSSWQTSDNLFAVSTY
jgi:hypothetical protein